VAAPFKIGGVSVAPGQRVTVDLAVATLMHHQPIAMPVHVMRGARPGPRLFVSSCLHGDEVNGIEIVRRLMRMAVLQHLRGTLITVPVVNMPAFLNRTRYLPDRRDLNRLFPGSENGSIGARIARFFIENIVSGSDAGIDLHTGAVNRPNLPHLRINPTPDTRRLAAAFAPPAIMEGNAPEGSFRQYSESLGIPTLLYEAGEAIRLEAQAVRIGLSGIVATMRELEMLPKKAERGKPTPITIRSSTWVRAPIGGILTPLVPLGRAVVAGTRLGLISNPFGREQIPVPASSDGIVIGRTNLAMVDEGEALFHIAQSSDPIAAEASIWEQSNWADEARHEPVSHHQTPPDPDSPATNDLP